MEPTGQGWMQVAELGTAFGLSALIGLERELKQKAAGIRTYTVVGLGSALFMLISKYGFTDVLEPDRVVLDPSRVAAQIVSGLGFIGAGIIFVRRGSVRGLTTAASIWLTAAVGAAAGAGLELLAVLATAAYFCSISLLPMIARALASWIGPPPPTVRVEYLDGRGLLRAILTTTTGAGFVVSDVEAHHSVEPGERPWAAVSMTLGGRGNVSTLLTELSETDGVIAVSAGDDASE